MQPRDILTRAIGFCIFQFDLVERHGRSVHQPRARRAILQKILGHDRARIEADWASREQIAAAHGNEVGRTGACTDEMHRHLSSPPTAIAHATGPTTILGPSRTESLPAAASAAASQTELTPVSSRALSERLTVRPA